MHKCSSSKATAVQRCQLVTTIYGQSGTGGVGWGAKLHADWQLTGSEPSGIEYVQQYKHKHNFAAVFIPLFCTMIWRKH